MPQAFYVIDAQTGHADVVLTVGLDEDQTENLYKAMPSKLNTKCRNFVGLPDVDVELLPAGCAAYQSIIRPTTEFYVD